MYSGILAGMSQAKAAQEAIELQRELAATYAPMRYEGMRSLEKLETALRGKSEWVGATRYRPISCRSCGANVSSIEQACSYCKTER